MKPLISVIIPIYKVEKYLNKCVDSILNQTYTNLEVILVDDGSPDGCPSICDEYAKFDKRIKVIHKQNGGLSSARNAGIDIAKGEYFAFVDSDDWVNTKYIESMYDAIIKTNADMAICNFQKVDENGNLLETSNNINNSSYSDDKFDLLFVNSDLTTVVAWNKLYARHIFNTLRYPEGKIHEDEFVIYDVINNCKLITTITDRLYNYLIRNDSIMGVKTPNLKMLDCLDAIQLRLERVGDDSKYYHVVCEHFLSNHIDVYNKVRKDKQLRELIIQRYKQNFHYIHDIRGFKTKIKCIMFRYLPCLTAWIVRL